MTKRKIRVMIVDDSTVFQEFFSRSLSNEPSIQVVGIAGDAFEAKKLVGIIRPDVITLDMEMPKMRGPEFLQYIIPRYPYIKTVVISSLSSNVFEALHAGAVDFVSKPNTRPGFDNTAFMREVVAKIKIAANSRVQVEDFIKPQSQLTENPKIFREALRPSPQSVIAVGASTGGTEALLTVFQDLPVSTPGILVVQHMPPVFTRMYAERLDQNCIMNAREAKNGDRVEPGLILVAPDDQHMRLRSDANGYYVRCESGDKVSGHCPSVDVLFESVAQYAGANALGVILTGMGADGAKQLLAMRKTGAHTIGQDRQSSVVYGMPMVAYNIGAVTEQLPLMDISEAILRHFTKR